MNVVPVTRWQGIERECDLAIVWYLNFNDMSLFASHFLSQKAAWVDAAPAYQHVSKQTDQVKESRGPCTPMFV